MDSLATGFTAVDGRPPHPPLRLSKLESAAVTTLVSGDAGTLLAEVEALAQQLASPTDSGSNLTRRQLLARRIATQDVLASQLEVLLATAIKKRDERGASFLSRMLTAATARLATLSTAHAVQLTPRTGRSVVVVGAANAVAIDARQGAR